MLWCKRRGVLARALSALVVVAAGGSVGSVVFCSGV